jgi:hypothetical protein
MTQLIAIDANALADLRQEVSRLHKRLDAVQMTPRPEWVTVAEFAEIIGKSRRTVLRRIQEGELESKNIAGARMVRVIQGA